MTTMQEIMEVLEAHKREVSCVTLPRAVDCTPFWDELTNQVYYVIPGDARFNRSNNPDDTRLWDSAIRESMQEFAKVDSLELVNKKGKILKRFSYYFKDQWGVKLPDNLAGIIGDKIQYFVSKESSEFFYDFTDVIDWNDGHFGKDDSCWWGCYGKSRHVFTDNGGWAIRFYDSMDDEYGIGRTWILPREGVLFGFNAYGIARPKVSKALKAIFAQHGIILHYKVMDKLYNSQNSDIPYINHDSNPGSSGAFVMYPDGMSESDVPTVYDMDMEVDSDDDCVICDHCGERIYDDDYNIVNDNTYCENCTDKLFSYCDRCEGYCDTSEVHKVEGHNRYDHLCESCLRHEGYVKCYQCDEYVEEYVTDSDGDTFCESCAENHLTHCEKCNEYFYTQTHYDLHECVDLDYSGLIECKDYTLHAQITRARTDGDIHTVTVYKTDGLSGLTLFNVKDIDSKLSGWNISHDISGLTVKSGIESFYAAKALFLDIASLGADWDVPAEELSGNRELMDKMSAMIKAYITE